LAEQTDTRPGTDSPRRSGRRSLYLFLGIIAAIIVYAFGFQVTDVTLEEIRSESRQEQLVRVIRDLARPEIFTYERIATNTDTEIFLPCPAGGQTAPEVDPDSRHIVIEPSCVEPGGTITVTGTNFSPNARGTLRQVPPEGDLELRLEEFQVAEDGSFTVVVDTRERPNDLPQTIRAVTREPIGSIFGRVEVQTDEIDATTGEPITVMSPRFSQAAKDTWERIIETVFLALLATTLGTMLAIPLSFIAAKNLMKDVKSTVTKLALQIIVLPFGLALGVWLSQFGQRAAELINDTTALLIIALVGIPLAIWLLLRWAFSPEDDDHAQLPMPGRIATIGVVAAAAIIELFLIAHISQSFGDWAAERLGGVAFLGGFLSSLGEILQTIIIVITALLAAGVAMNIAGRIATRLRNALPGSVVRPLDFALAAAAGGLFAYLFGQIVGWLYRITDPQFIVWLPVAAGALIGIYMAARAMRSDSVRVGLAIYYVARTVFNTIRSIEPLVMVLVFVVWVGIGPFAGSLALALHTVAALAKLYSEQVESIAAGPIEAVRATGANRVQTIIYAVIPQIVPPYISFTMYRWDINVRMSTIIGFAGGGGIGFLLQQNIRLLNYKAAAVNMLAIAIVVASMDYVSSRIREKIV
jgi:phosphonate ABC transporter permease subunit PhnE